MASWTEAEAFFLQASAKFEVGDPIDDFELAALIEQYQQGCKFLELLGPEFGLARKECRQRLFKLQDYRESRRNRA